MMTRLAIRAYRCLLYLLPADFRRDYGPDMASTFEAILLRTRPMARLSVFARATVDVLSTILRGDASAERARSARRPRRIASILEALRCDLTLARRRLVGSRLTTAISVLILGAGIAATCTVYAVVDSILLQPLEYAHPERLVALFLHEVTHGNERAPTSPRSFLAWREQASSLELMTAAHPWQPVLTGREHPLQLDGLRATPSLFDLLGVSPLLGRTFTEALVADSNPRIIVLGHGLWQRQFGADPSVVGQSLTLNGEAHTVVAVMPKGFAFPPFWATEAEMWAPLVLGAEEAQSDARYLRVFARRREDASFRSAKSELDVIGARLVEADPRANAGTAIRVEPLREPVISGVRHSLWVLLGAVSAVLLIACVNVSGLTAVRASGRHRDIAISRALGASRFRLRAPALLEGLLLSLASGGVGLGAASLVVGWIARFGPDDVPRLASVSIGGEATAVALAICLFAGIFVGLFPATRSSQRRPFLVAQIAMALVLLTSAGLLARSYRNLATLSPGFQREGVVTMTLVLDQEMKGDRTRQRALLADVERAVVSLPGVERAGFVNHLPIGGDLWGISFARTDLAEPEPGDRLRASFRVATPDYLDAIGIPLLRGRLFTSDDDRSTANHVLVNERLATTTWPGEDAVGRQIQIGGDVEAHWTVIGVVGDVRQNALTEAVRAEIYFPYRKNPSPDYLMTSLAVRTSLPPERAIPPIQDAIWKTRAGIAVAQTRTIEHILSDSIGQQRFNSGLMLCFATLAIILAALGLYGVISHSVTKRAREMAIRQAVGARPTDLSRHVLAYGLEVVAWGVGLGLAAAFVTADALRSLLFGIAPTDPGTYVVATLVLVVVAMASCYLPARRASRLDPVLSLKLE